MTQKSELEQAALLLLKEAKTYHPLVTSLVARVINDPTYTGALPTYGDLTSDEWAPYAFGGGYSKEQISEKVEKEAKRYKREDIADSVRLEYPLPNDYYSEINELAREHHNDVDRAVLQFVATITLYRMGQKDQLIQAIARYHELVVRLEVDFTHESMVAQK